MIFTTLFDSYYLDRGLLLYRSLENVTDDFKLYIFCFDDKSYEILQEYDLKHAILVHHSEFEDEALLKLKKERTKAEYCWTCTSVTIKYVLEHFGEPNCTYIDADMYFFSNPRVLFDEIEQNHADIVITPHRFSDSHRDKRLCKRSGKYCVEFNYFNTTNNAMEALDWWIAKCAEWCFHIYEPERMGDQKYLEKFPVLFKGVHELEHLGGGMAPWNLKQYKLYSKAEDIVLETKSGNEKFSLVFYHFQNLRFLSENIVNVSSEIHDKKLKDTIYVPYLRGLVQIREELTSKYGMKYEVKKRNSSNRFIAFLQGTVLRFKIRSLSDIYRLKRL